MKKFEDYTEEEFLSFLKDLCSGPGALNGKEFEQLTIERVKHFEKNTQHPAKSDLIFYPENDQDDSPEGILKIVKDWRL